jgi:hypothetical protein
MKMPLLSNRRLRHLPYKLDRQGESNNAYQ